MGTVFCYMDATHHAALLTPAHLELFTYISPIKKNKKCSEDTTELFTQSSLAQKWSLNLHAIWITHIKYFIIQFPRMVLGKHFPFIWCIKTGKRIDFCESLPFEKGTERNDPKPNEPHTGTYWQHLMRWISSDRIATLRFQHYNVMQVGRGGGRTHVPPLLYGLSHSRTQTQTLA